MGRTCRKEPELWRATQRFLRQHKLQACNRKYTCRLEKAKRGLSIYLSVGADGDESESNGNELHDGCDYW